jgi:antitoxin YefM
VKFFWRGNFYDEEGRSLLFHAGFDIIAVIVKHFRSKMMIKALKQQGIVGKAGKIELHSPELEEGTSVDIIILVSDSEPDTTEYLLSTEANRRELSEAMERVENQENLVTITAKEWHEKYRI